MSLAAAGMAMTVPTEAFTLVTLLAGWQMLDGNLTRLDALVLGVVFAVFMIWSVRQGMAGGSDPLGTEMSQELASHPMPLRTAVMWLVIGLLLLIGSSRLLVWGSVEVAHFFGISDLIIGLTIVAISHQPAWVGLADRVYQLENHVVTEVTGGTARAAASAWVTGMNSGSATCRRVSRPAGTATAHA